MSLSLRHFLWVPFVFFELTYNYTKEASMSLQVGATRMADILPALKGKQVALVVNHSSLISGRHLADTLFDQGICLARIFAPEHGFRGEADAGEKIQDDLDVRTGTPIVSLYGKKMKPAAADLLDVDIVVFDIQDVGTRFYTYISTLFLVMEACAEQGKPLIVLDRPNPNGHYVDGPVLDMRYSSFIGIAPLPIVHGCTVGELALLFKGEHWIRQADKLDLKVFTCVGYTHERPYVPPLRPSPNLPNARAILLYPSLCFFEGTVVSLGRGTDFPFQVIGHPGYLQGDFEFTPMPNAGNKKPLLSGALCKGIDFRGMSIDSIYAQKQINLQPLLHFYRGFEDKNNFFLENRFFNLLAGNSKLMEQVKSGCTEEEIRQSWASDLRAFREIRQNYLLYP
jgi:uncharacterized protein YbbC (DUF1343 family)